MYATMSLSTAAHPSTPKQQSLHASLPSCPPAPKRQQPQPASNDSMLIDFDLPAVPALNLQQTDFLHSTTSTTITLKPRPSSNNHNFPTYVRGRSPWKVCRIVKHPPRLGSANAVGTANLTQTFASTSIGGTAGSTRSTKKKMMSKLSPRLSHPPLNRRQQQQLVGGRHRSASFSSPAA